MNLTEDQITKLSDALEEGIDSAEIQDPELRKVAHADMLRLAVGIVEQGTFSYEIILAMAEETARGTKIQKMSGVEMEEDMKEMAVKRGLMKKD